MKKSTKLIMTGAASLLGVALAAGGAYATNGSLSLTDAPGQQLKISGIAPAADTANQNALENANKNAKGLFGVTPDAPQVDPEVDADADTDADAKASTDTSTDTSTEVKPVAPRDAAAAAPTVKGSETGQSVSAWAHEKNGVEVVLPDAAVDVKADANAKAEVRGDNR